MCVSLIVKYILIIVNLVFSLAGLALVGVGVAVLVQTSRISDLVPVNLSAIPITVIVLGCVIFAIAFCGCCGAMRQSKCLLFMYAIVMGILAAGKIAFVVILLRGLNDIQETTQGWVYDAFENLELFPVLEIAFRCCGTTGPNSYDGIYQSLPTSCCGSLTSSSQCYAGDAFDGCVDVLGNYFESFGDAIAGVFIALIIAELVLVLFSVFLCSCNNKKR